MESEVTGLVGAELSERRPHDRMRNRNGYRPREWPTSGWPAELQWHLHDLWPELALPDGVWFLAKKSARIGRRPARTEQSMLVNALEGEIAQRVAQVAPHLLQSPASGR